MSTQMKFFTKTHYRRTGTRQQGLRVTGFLPPQTGEDLNIPRVIPRSRVLGDSKAERGRLADTCTLSFGRVLRKYEASLTARRACCFYSLVQDGGPGPGRTARWSELTLHLSLSPKQGWAPHRDGGVQRSHSAGRTQSSLSQQLLVAGLVDSSRLGLRLDAEAPV